MIHSQAWYDDHKYFDTPTAEPWREEVRSVKGQTYGRYACAVCGFISDDDDDFSRISDPAMCLSCQEKEDAEDMEDKEDK